MSEFMEVTFTDGAGVMQRKSQIRVDAIKDLSPDVGMIHANCYIRFHGGAFCEVVETPAEVLEKIKAHLAESGKTKTVLPEILPKVG